jgi:hypothetical protein
MVDETMRRCHRRQEVGREGCLVNSEEILAMADERFERRLTEESAAIRQEIAALRSEMATRAETQAIRDDVNAIRQTMATHQDVNDLRQEMSSGFIRLERELSNTRVDMIKWSFMFWTGQCLAILGFLFVFLRNQ